MNERATYGKLVGFSADLERLVPGPGVLSELLVGVLVGVKRSELVRLPVRGDIECWSSLLSFDDKDSGDDAVVGLSVD